MGKQNRRSYCVRYRIGAPPTQSLNTLLGIHASQVPLVRPMSRRRFRPNKRGRSSRVSGIVLRYLERCDRTCPPLAESVHRLPACHPRRKQRAAAALALACSRRFFGRGRAIGPKCQHTRHSGHCRKRRDISLSCLLLRRPAASPDRRQHGPYASKRALEQYATNVMLVKSLASLD